MMSMYPKDIAIFNIRGVDYHCIINGINKSQAVNLLQNADLHKKNWIIIEYNFFLSRIKDG